jgi:putative DNA primase/helicase
MLQLARAVEGMTISQSALDSDPMLLGTENGTVDLRTGELVPSQRGQLISKRVATAFDPPATCPEFERFLLEIMDGRQELVDYLARLFGYALTGRTTEQIIAFAYGVGATSGPSIWEIRGLQP